MGRQKKNKTNFCILGLEDWCIFMGCICIVCLLDSSFPNFFLTVGTHQKEIKGHLSQNKTSVIAAIVCEFFFFSFWSQNHWLFQGWVFLILNPDTVENKISLKACVKRDHLTLYKKVKTFVCPLFPTCFYAMVEDLCLDCMDHATLYHTTD